MGELLRFNQTHHSRNTFDRVKTAEQPVQQGHLDLPFSKLLFDREKIPANLDKMLLALGVVIIEKLAAEIGVVLEVRHQFSGAWRSFSACERRSADWNGLV